MRTEAVASVPARQAGVEAVAMFSVASLAEAAAVHSNLLGDEGAARLYIVPCPGSGGAVPSTPFRGSAHHEASELVRRRAEKDRCHELMDRGSPRCQMA